MIFILVVALDLTIITCLMISIFPSLFRTCFVMAAVGRVYFLQIALVCFVFPVFLLVLVLYVLRMLLCFFLTSRPIFDGMIEKCADQRQVVVVVVLITFFFCESSYAQSLLFDAQKPPTRGKYLKF